MNMINPVYTGSNNITWHSLSSFNIVPMMTGTLSTIDTILKHAKFRCLWVAVRVDKALAQRNLPVKAPTVYYHLLNVTTIYSYKFKLIQKQISSRGLGQ